MLLWTRTKENVPVHVEVSDGCLIEQHAFDSVDQEHLPVNASDVRWHATEMGGTYKLLVSLRHYQWWIMGGNRKCAVSTDDGFLAKNDLFCDKLVQAKLQKSVLLMPQSTRLLNLQLAVITKASEAVPTSIDALTYDEVLILENTMAPANCERPHTFDAKTKARYSQFCARLVIQAMHSGALSSSQKNKALSQLRDSSIGFQSFNVIFGSSWGMATKFSMCLSLSAAREAWP